MGSMIIINIENLQANDFFPLVQIVIYSQDHTQINICHTHNKFALTNLQSYSISTNTGVTWHYCIVLFCD